MLLVTLRARGLRAALVCALLCSAVMAGAQAQSDGAPPPIPAQPGARDAEPPDKNDLLGRLSAQLTDIVGSARTAVVSIKGKVDVIVPAGAQPPTGGNSNETRQPVTVKMTKTGSGFLLPGGIVVTTAEVVANLQDPVVVLEDGSRVKIAAIRRDPQANIAMLSVPDVDQNIGLRWGDSLEVESGNIAITIGNEDGFAASVTLGIISTPDQQAQEKGHRYRHLIQFKPALGAGGSGSPLMNTRGEVIGMVIGMAVRPEGTLGDRQLGSRFNQDTEHAEAGPVSSDKDASSSPLTQVIILGGSNSGFALPSNYVKAAIDAFSKGAKRLPAMGWFGVKPGKSKKAGVEIDGIYNDGPADKAGVQPGDTVTVINGHRIRSEKDLQRISDELFEGQDIDMTVERDGKPLRLHLHIQERPENDTIKDLPCRTLPPRVGSMPDSSPSDTVSR